MSQAMGEPLKGWRWGAGFAVLPDIALRRQWWRRAASGALLALVMGAGWMAAAHKLRPAAGHFLSAKPGKEPVPKGAVG